MIGLRLLAVVLAIGAAVPLGLHFAGEARRELRALPTPTATPAHPRAGGHDGRRRRARRANDPATRRRAGAGTARSSREGSDGGVDRRRVEANRLLLITGLELAAGVLLLVGATGALAARRLRRRRTRHYGLYEVRLSTHDEAKPQDLEDMVEALANVVRAFPMERARDGQPHVSVELLCLPGPPEVHEVEWSLNVRCEPAVVDALDAVISAAYPDVRLGRDHAQEARPREEALGVPRRVMRFRKDRSFVYPLIAAGDEPASPPLEQIAHAQVALRAPSAVRFQLTPAPAWFEALARRLYRRHENRLLRAERWGLPEGGLTSTLNRAEMRAAQQTQNRGLFWLELTVAADTLADGKAIAAAVQARRGENRLHRRRMVLRRRLYRGRFPRALAPLIPSPRALVSAAEVAHLLELPSARMKGVPVRRATVPRIPAPPEALRADDLAPIATPTMPSPPARVSETASLPAAA